jgi:opacity protein-like surface antigen
MRFAFLRPITWALCLAVLVTFPTTASAQSPPASSEQAGKPKQPAKPAPTRPRESIGVRGFGLFGATFFTAKDSFDAVLGSRSGAIFGGGGQLTFPIGLYVEAAAWRFSADGERVFVGPDDEVFPLRIPTTVRVTPLEITSGWRFRNLSRYLVPYAGGGVNWHRYEETSDFAESGEDVDDRFTGYHLLGGVEVRLHRWIYVSGEVALTSVPDALGESGVSAAFDEDNLGGTSLRFKILVGR